MFFLFFLFFIKMMLIRSSLPSSNPATLLGTIVLLSETEPNVGKSRKSSKMDFSLVLSMYQCTKGYQWANGNKIMICPLFLVKYFPEGLGVVPGVFLGLYGSLGKPMERIWKKTFLKYFFVIKFSFFS